MRADKSGEPRQTVMIIAAGDSTCEELYFWGGGAAAVQRGYNALCGKGLVKLVLTLWIRP
jgi:hypothetical protein